MAIERLDHCLILAEDLHATRDFYTEVLGLETGPRPPFEFPGYWLYAGDVACVHLAEAARDGGPARGGGAVDHVAFAADDLEGTRARLRAAGVETRERNVPGAGLTQLFVRDPNGVSIELSFRAAPVR